MTYNIIYSCREANNNNSPLADMRLSNNNTYYMAEVAPPSSPMRQTSSPGPHAAGGMHQPLRGHVHHRLHPRYARTTEGHGCALPVLVVMCI